MTIRGFVPLTANMTQEELRERIRLSRPLRLYEELERVGEYKKLPTDGKILAKQMCDELWHPDMHKSGTCKVSGVVLDFRAWMRRVWVDFEHYGIQERWAFNKTLLRQTSQHPSYIRKIIEIEGNAAQ